MRAIARAARQSPLWLAPSALVLLLLSAASSAAADTSVRGVVFDGSGPLNAFPVVLDLIPRSNTQGYRLQFIPPLGAKSSTDDRGRFEFLTVEPGTYRLWYENPFFAQWTSWQEITVTAGQRFDVGELYVTRRIEIVRPVHQSSAHGSAVILEWKPIAGAAQYHVDVRQLGGGRDRAIKTERVFTTVSDLAPGSYCVDVLALTRNIKVVGRIRMTGDCAWLFAVTPP